MGYLLLKKKTNDSKQVIVYIYNFHHHHHHDNLRKINNNYMRNPLTYQIFFFNFQRKRGIYRVHINNNYTEK